MIFTKPRRLGGLSLDGRFKDVRFRSVAFSPDGQRIVVSIRSSLRSDILQIDRDGKNVLSLASAGRTPRGHPRDTYYWDLQITPNGTHLLYGLCEEDEEVKTVCLLDLATKEQKRLTEPGAMHTMRPRLSLDGQSVIFESWRAGVANLCQMTIATREMTQLTHTPVESKDGPNDAYLPGNIHPAYSPDGQHIAFHSSDYAGKTDNPLQVVVMRSDGTSVRRLTDLPADCGAPFWHPDGNQIAFTVQTELPAGIERTLWKYRLNLCLVKPDGSDLRRLEESVSVNGIGGFSPDGRHIVYRTSGDERFPDGKRNWDIRLLEIETGAVHRVTDDDFYNSDPIFSPDGDSILFISKRDGYCGLHQTDIHATTF